MAAFPLRVSALLLGAFALTMAFQSFALELEPGRRVPEIRVEKWFFEELAQKDGSEPQTKKSDSLSALLLFNCSDPGAFAVLRYLETAKADSDGFIRDVRAVSVNTPEILDDFLKRNGKLSFPVGVDKDDSATFKAYCGVDATLPMAFVVFPDGTLAWSGHPSGIEGVVKRIKNGSFDVSSQRKISALRRELQTAIQSGLPAVVARNAERILLLDPGDMIAVQAKLYALETQSDFKGARDFLQSSCAKSPKDHELSLLFMSFLARTGEFDAFSAEAAKAFANFKDDAAFQGRFCAFMLDSAPFGYMPLPLVLAAAKANLARSSSSASPDAKASAAELMARASYCCGRLADAVAFQAQALELRKGGSFEVPAAKLLDFYRQGQTLQSSK